MDYNTPSNTGIVPTATHIGYLAGMINHTAGPIMELGVGHYSTPLLHYMRGNRLALSIESDLQWYKFFYDRYGSSDDDRHEFLYTEKRLISDVLSSMSGEWDVVFIDNSPASDRKKCIEVLRGRAAFLVVHDSEPEAEAYGWDGIFDTFKYKFTCPFYTDSTTVVSDVSEIPIK